MKYLFGLVLLILAASATGMAGVVVLRWNDNMSQSPKIVPGERVFAAMPAGTVPRTGGELALPREEREAAAKRPNPVKTTPQSVAAGKDLYLIYCAVCHGPDGKGGGPVAPKFIPPPDLSHASIQKGRSDGYLQHVIGAGGAVMPAYGEALSPQERWHLVNFLRSLARQ
ncbi:MAG: cytochrome c [candidate division NC10 bacterium]